MLKYYSIPDTPGVVVRKANVAVEQLELPPDSVYLYYDELDKCLKLWDGTQIIELTSLVYNKDETFTFFCYVSDLPFTDNELP
jgi:hypothetical protein